MLTNIKWSDKDDGRRLNLFNLLHGIYVYAFLLLFLKKMSVEGENWVEMKLGGAEIGWDRNYILSIQCDMIVNRHFIDRNHSFLFIQ